MEGSKVCILTAGKGTRMGPYSGVTNKALLPVNEKAIISWIIEKFPPDKEIVVAIGYKGNFVKSYLELAHGGRKIHFVNVDHYEGPGSGPGYSLLQCEPLLRCPFYFVSCDTLWKGETDFNEVSDWVGVGVPTDPEQSNSYCNIQALDDRAVDLRDKEPVDYSNQFYAFSGLCFIKDYEKFWEALGSSEAGHGEVQMTAGLKGLIQGNSVKVKELVWEDVGNYKAYKKLVEESSDFNFNKVNEFFYTVNGKVIKFFFDPDAVTGRVKKASLNAEVFPKIEKHAENFFSYQYAEGRTLYKNIDLNIFEDLLSWLSEKLWMPQNVDNEVLISACRTFYQEKTKKRLGLYLRKHQGSENIRYVNRKPVFTSNAILEKLNWNFLFEESYPYFIHGDLQFDNIIYDESSGHFVLLDWRQDFARYTQFGDIYYDFAKLLGGIFLNYDYIKKGLFSYRENGEAVFIDYAQWASFYLYEKELQDFIERKGYSWKKVRMLVGIIYLNMSPLHESPFDQFLYALGLQVLTDEVQCD